MHLLGVHVDSGEERPTELFEGARPGGHDASESFLLVTPTNAGARAVDAQEEVESRDSRLFVAALVACDWQECRAAAHGVPLNYPRESASYEYTLFLRFCQ